MDSSEDKWAKFHEKALPYDLAITKEPFKTLIEIVESFVSQYKLNLVLETGFGTGYVMIELSKRLKAKVAGIETSDVLIYRASNLAEKEGTKPLIKKADMFNPNIYEQKRMLIYHQGVLEHLSDKAIQEILHLQLKNSFAVIFSVPSKFYNKQDFGDERLLTLKEWEKILEFFEVYQIRYYDDNRHILGILKGGFYG